MLPKPKPDTRSYVSSTCRWQTRRFVLCLAPPHTSLHHARTRACTLRHCFCPTTNTPQLQVERSCEHTIDELQQRLQDQGQLLVRLKTVQGGDVPKDEQVLRAQIHEQVEGQFQAQVRAAKAETSRFKDMWQKAQHDHDVLKAEFEAFADDQGKEMEAASAAATDAQRELRRQLQGLRAEQDKAAANARQEVRALQADIQQLTVKLSAAQAEAETMRSQRDAAAAAAANAESTMHQRVLAAENAARAAERSNDTHAVRASALEAAAARARQQVSELTVAMQSAERRARDAESRLSDTQGRLDTARAQGRAELDAAKQVALRERKKLEVQLTAALQRADQSAERLTSAEQAALTAERAYQRNLQDLRQRYEEQLAEVQRAAEHSPSDGVIVVPQDELAGLRGQADAARQRAEQANEATQQAQSRLSAAQAERDRVARRAEQAEAALAVAQAEARDAQAELVRMRSTVSELRDMSSRGREDGASLRHALASARAQLQAEQEARAAAVNTATKLRAHIEHLTAQHEHALQQAEGEAAAQRSAAQAQASQELHASKDKCKSYQVKLLALYNKYKKLQATSAANIRLHVTQAADAQDQAESMRRRLRALESEHELLLTRATRDVSSAL